MIFWWGPDKIGMWSAQLKLHQLGLIVYRSTDTYDKSQCRKESCKRGKFFDSIALECFPEEQAIHLTHNWCVHMKTAIALLTKNRCNDRKDVMPFPNTYFRYVPIQSFENPMTRETISYREILHQIPDPLPRYAWNRTDHILENVLKRIRNFFDEFRKPDWKPATLDWSEHYMRDASERLKMTDTLYQNSASLNYYIGHVLREKNEFSVKRILYYAILGHLDLLTAKLNNTLDDDDGAAESSDHQQGHLKNVEKNYLSDLYYELITAFDTDNPSYDDL